MNTVAESLAGVHTQTSDLVNEINMSIIKKIAIKPIVL